MRSSGDKWVLAFVFLVLLVGGYFVTRHGRAVESEISSTHNADPKGTKAMYTLLGERLGFKVDRLLRSYDELPKDASVLVVPD